MPGGIVPAPRRAVNPFFQRHVRQSPTNKRELAIRAGFPWKQQLSFVLRDEYLSATPRMVARLEFLADLVGFPRDQIFLEGGR